MESTVDELTQSIERESREKALRESRGSWLTCWLREPMSKEKRARLAEDGY